MLTKIEVQEIMTKRQAAEKYYDKYFHFVTTKEVDRLDNDLGYVIYTYDCGRDMRGIPRKELEGKMIGRLVGVAAEKGIHVGGIIVYDGD